MANDSSILPLFKDQLEAESKAIGQAHGLTERGHLLTWWYFKRLHPIPEEDIASIVCDGGGDLGIDALWIQFDDDGEAIVHFYQFKNPEDLRKGIPAGEVDKVLGGLTMIVHKNYGSIANPKLKGLLEAMFRRLPKGYHLHFVSSGTGIQRESKEKVKAFVASLGLGTHTYFHWSDEHLRVLHNDFYQHQLPTIRDPIRFVLKKRPYAVRSSLADSHFFHLDGALLADLYSQHGEQLLQRNIRVDQGATATNRSIEASCSGSDSGNFLHFNNGITFICESADWDEFHDTFTIQKAQVVNGGQTIRALHKAKLRGSLQPDVAVPVRAIASRGDKDFATNVAVNQNNQNQINPTFLRSNDSPVVQLGHTLASLGWYLERRAGELKGSTKAEIEQIERRIGAPLEGRVIKLKDGMQAYVATFMQRPELAKKNPSKIFLGQKERGYYEQVFGPEISAQKIVIAHKTKVYVDAFVKDFTKRRDRKNRSPNWVEEYGELLGSDLVNAFRDDIDQVIPQSGMFLCGAIFLDYVKLRGMDPQELPESLGRDGMTMIRESISQIITFAKTNPENVTQAWPTLLKSGSFYDDYSNYLTGLRSGQGIARNGGSAQAKDPTS